MVFCKSFLTITSKIRQSNYHVISDKTSTVARPDAIFDSPRERLWEKNEDFIAICRLDLGFFQLKWIQNEFKKSNVRWDENGFGQERRNRQKFE